MELLLQAIIFLNSLILFIIHVVVIIFHLNFKKDCLVRARTRTCVLQVTAFTNIEKQTRNIERKRVSS